MVPKSLNRREILARSAGGIGSIALAMLLGDSARGEMNGGSNPLAPKPAHGPPRARNVIFVFMTGGVSHVDTFDPKPRLIADHNKQVTVNGFRGKVGEFKMYLKQPSWKFERGGQCGTEISDLFPEVRKEADELCLIRSMVTDHTGHYQSTLGMHTGSFTFARPSLGAWVSYGLGSENQNLPSFIVLAPYAPYAGTQTWNSDFLPAYHQAMHVVPGPNPVANVQRIRETTRQQELELAFVNDANRAHVDRVGADLELEGRIRSFETAFHMQTAAPEAFDIAQETESTLKGYGVSHGETSGFGWQCLMARRLVERGVRFVELIDTGSSHNWDSHGDMNDHALLAGAVDRPISALLADLRQRGLLDETLVVWTTEFGRTPFNERPDMKGREHHHIAFSSWMAGGGVKRGLVHGETDELGLEVVRDRVHLHDFHATILHLLGLDHEHLTFRHGGRDYRLTDVHGKVVHEILA